MELSTVRIHRADHDLVALVCGKMSLVEGRKLNQPDALRKVLTMISQMPIDVVTDFRPQESN